MKQMEVEQWLSYMKGLSTLTERCPYALGIALRHALLRAPTCWGSSARRQHALTLTAFFSLEDWKAEAKRHGDLLPLPLKISGMDLAWDEQAKDFETLSRLPRQVVEAAGRKSLDALRGHGAEQSSRSTANLRPK